MSNDYLRLDWIMKKMLNFSDLDIQKNKDLWIKELKREQRFKKLKRILDDKK